MKLSNGLLSRNNKILIGKGEEWSKESIAIMEMFLQWLTVSNLEKTKCLNRINGEMFEILFYSDDDKIEIVLSDESGKIGVSFLWDKESGVQREHYLTDAGILLFYIGSMCSNEKSIKKINDFIRKYF